MQIGIFGKTFVRSTITDVLDAIAAHGIHLIQFNMASAGLPSMPDQIPAEVSRTVARELRRRDIHIVALSGTFNMIHPSPAERARGLSRLDLLAGFASALGSPLITLCTGTRHPTDMWQAHAENESAEAWHDLLQSLERAVQIAEQFDLCLGIEPEQGNVINSARKAAQLLKEMRSPRLKIVFDAANLLHHDTLCSMGTIVDEACDLLGPHIAIAHAKDIDPSGRHVAAGKGVLDYDLFLQGLSRAQFAGPVILHGLQESDVTPALEFLRSKLAAVQS